jgi:hypothetical protein
MSEQETEVQENVYPVELVAGALGIAFNSVRYWHDQNAIGEATYVRRSRKARGQMCLGPANIVALGMVLSLKERHRISTFKAATNFVGNMNLADLELCAEHKQRVLGLGDEVRLICADEPIETGDTAIPVVLPVDLAVASVKRLLGLLDLVTSEATYA